MPSMINDEIEVSSGAVHRVLTKVFLDEIKFYDDYYFVCDDSLLSDYLLSAINIVSKKSFYFLGNAYFVPAGEKSEMVKDLLLSDSCRVKEIKAEDFKNLKCPKKRTSCVIFVADSNNFKNKDSVLGAIECTTHFVKKNSSRVVFASLLPEMPDIPLGIDHLAEREFNYFVEDYKGNNTADFSFFEDIEKMLRHAVRDEECDISLLRFDNIFSPDREHIMPFNLSEIIKEIFKAGKVSVTEDDYKVEFTLTYVRDAISALIYALYYAKPGHAYNVASYTTNVAEIKNAIHSKCKSQIKLESKVDLLKEPAHRSLGTLKFQKLGFEARCSLEDAVYHAVCHLSEIEFDIAPLIAFYEGKLQRLKDLEVYILMEMERVCKKHNIKYFLAGGSLLGAVRNGMSIQWDDDLDIGMLREDYDKFKKVFQEEMGDQFVYSSPYNKSGSHYTIDKVRLKDTYFSTNFSSKNMTEDGIFVDILVYDRTSNNPLLQKMHMMFLYAITKALEVRWYNTARKNFHYKASKIILPFLRLIPYSVYHRVFDFGASFYKNKKDAKYLIDSVGKKLKDGAMPIKGLEEVKYVDFDGFKAPIPVDPTGYLNYAYGPNYMQLPTYSKRSAPHSFARVDMGEYIFENKTKAQFRRVDIRGELYEEEK